ncbi:MAG: hypothetical protein HYY02_02010 [Chloroflexi bacterium]|nr:hypothetical protein [Chloroflexota bacterium]
MTTKIKKYRAATIADALRLVKADLGPDAIILDSQRVRQPGIQGWFKAPVLEVSAVTEAEGLRLPREPWAPRTQRRAPEPAAEAPTPASGLQLPRESPLFPLDAATSALLRKQSQQNALPASAGPLARPAAATAEVRGSPDGVNVEMERLAQAVQEVQREVATLIGLHRELSRELAQVLTRSELYSSVSTRRRSRRNPESSPESTVTAIPGSLRDRVQRLLRLPHEDTGLVTRILQAAALPPGAEELPMEEEQVLAALRGAVGRLAKTPASLALVPGETRVIFLAGSTGVGKTTAAAKLAAHYAQHHAVALATVGRSGFMSTSQLVAHCARWRARFRACGSTAALAAFLEEASGQAEAIFVDTPGVCFSSGPQVQDLLRLTGAAQDARVWLVAAASMQEALLQQATQALAGLPLDALVLTKLDETETPGALVSAAMAADLPIGYLATGQDLRWGLEEASAESIARLLVKADAPAPEPALAGRPA